MRHSFNFGGVDSSAFLAHISGSGIYNVPAREYEHIQIPGRDGDLLGIEKRLANIEVTYPCFILDNFDINLSALKNALVAREGYQRLTDTYHPDEYRLGVYEGDTEMSVSKGLQAGSFELTFNCKPQRYLTSGESWQTILGASGFLTNPGQKAKPKVKIVTDFSGASASAYAELNFIDNGTSSQYWTIRIENGAPETVYLDTETMTFTDSNNALVTSHVSVSLTGIDSAYLFVGVTHVQYSGSIIQSVQVLPRWWRV